MKRAILEVYALAVCFMTVVCFVIALGMALYGVVGMTNPEFTMHSYVYARHESNDAFWNRDEAMPFRPPQATPGAEPAKPRPPEAELTKLRLASLAHAIASERRDNAQTVVKTSIVVFIDLLVFLLHWAIGRKARAQAA